MKIFPKNFSTVIMFDENMRQSKDPPYAEILSRFRFRKRNALELDIRNIIVVTESLNTSILKDLEILDPAQRTLSHL